MPAFRYKALERGGGTTEGTIEAAGRQDAYKQLDTLGLKTISLNETEDKAGTGPQAMHTYSFHRHSKRVSFAALENFTRQLSSLLAAGVPLSRALRIVYVEASTPAASEKWKALHDRVVDGTSLADAMAQEPETFPRVFVAMTRAGETGGFLDVVLAQIAEFQSREKELRSRVLSALIYPAVLLVLSLSVLVFLLVFFIPRFQKIFEGFGAALPLLTRIIVRASELASDYGIFIAMAVVIFIALMRRWMASERGRRSWEQVVLRVPAIGTLIARFAMARFCRMLGTLLSAGVPLINALNVARRSLGNQVLIDAVGESTERVRQGDRLAASLTNCSELFPHSVLEMISVSEETGRLPDELIRLAEVTETDLDRQLRTTVALAEPLMLFLMACFIGTIFVGMVIPIFTIQDYIQ